MRDIPHELRLLSPLMSMMLVSGTWIAWELTSSRSLLCSAWVWASSAFSTTLSSKSSKPSVLLVIRLMYDESMFNFFSAFWTKVWFSLSPKTSACFKT